MSKKFKLIIGGIEYVINTDENEEYIRRLEGTLNERLRDISKRNQFLSTTMVALLAALEYCDESMKLKEKIDGMQQDMKGCVSTSACAKLDADQAKREIERLNREIIALRNKLADR